MANAAEKPRHPKGLAVLFFTEMWERFGFYTMLAIFVLYLDEYFHFRDVGQIYGLYLALVYFTPVGGGFIADKFGFRRTITIGAIMMAIGYGLIAVPIPEKAEREVEIVAAEQVYSEVREDYETRYEAARELAQAEGIDLEWDEDAPEYGGPGRVSGRALFFFALVVLVLGNGLFKPNISVMVGNLYPEGSPLKDNAFNIFYMGINIGAFFAPLAAAALRNNLGWGWAFGASAIGMVFSVLIFQGFRRHLMHAEIGRSADSTVQIKPMSREESRRRIGPKPEIDTRVREAAEILGLAEYLDRKPKALSGGQRQRVAVGRAIVRKPKVFLFDEPLSNLDAKLRVQMRSEISRLHKQLKATMLYVTHDQVEAMTMGTRITILKDGVVQQIDDPLSLYRRPVNRFVGEFIGSPSMNLFDGRLRRDGSGFVFEEATFSVSLGEIEGGASLPERLCLGLRPESLDVQEGESTTGTLDVRVELVEPLGSEIYVHGRTGEHPLVARIGPDHSVNVGDTVRLSIDQRKIHFFDGESGLALRPSPSSVEA